MVPMSPYEGTYIDTGQETEYEIVTDTAGATSSITYSITIDGLALPMDGFSYTHSGEELTFTISTTDAETWATGVPHSGVVTASTGDTATFSVDFCYVAAPDPLFS